MVEFVLLAGRGEVQTISEGVDPDGTADNDVDKQGGVRKSLDSGESCGSQKVTP